jgi:hypothetical protein
MGVSVWKRCKRGVAYHAYDESADKVEPGFFAALACDLVLCYTIVARDFCDWTEEEMCAVRQPIHPSQLCCTGNALQCVVSSLENNIVGHVFGLIIFCSRNL